MIGGFTNDINGAAPAAVCSLIVLVELKPQGAVWFQRGVGLPHVRVNLRCVVVK
jgi:hypothetical protein